MDIEQTSIALGISAGVVQLFGYWLYVRTMSDKVNAASWIIWTLGAFVDLASYIAITGDWVVNILPAACAFACVLTCLYMVAKRKFGGLDLEGWTFLIVDGGITFLWYTEKLSAVVANVAYQGSTVASFYPLIKGQLNGKDDKEHWSPWFIWTIAYGLLTASVVLRLKGIEELFYPVSHVVLHLIVFMVALYVRKRPAR